MLAAVGAALISLPAAGVLAVGLLVAGVALPVLATALTRRRRRRGGTAARSARPDAVDLTHGAADLAAFGATASATGRDRAAPTGWPGWNAGSPRPASRWTRPGCWSPG